MKGLIKHKHKIDNDDFVSTGQPCIHAYRTCESTCQFFDFEKLTETAYKAVLRCVTQPVTLIVEEKK